ncbi:MAG: hypothetical protein ACI845_003702 [Gammaproteobacteria bacterium]|jgi:hypothetical protein
MSDLRLLQQRFQQYLIGNSDEIESDIVSTADALAKHRLATYYNAYRIRLIDCLATDYSALDKYLGRDAFESLTLDYLKHYPSKHPSVRWFGKYLAEYLKTQFEGDDRELMGEIADYEWAQSLVFDAADESNLFRLEDMAQVQPESWGSITLVFKPAHQWRDLYWNVPAMVSSLENDQPTEANRDEDPVRWLLWRQQMTTHWRSLDVHEAWAFEQMLLGANFAVICEGLVEWVDAEQVALAAAGFLKQWITDELVISIDYEQSVT